MKDYITAPRKRDDPDLLDCRCIVCTVHNENVFRARRDRFFHTQQTKGQ